MKKKVVMSKGKRRVFLFLHRLMAAAAIGCMMTVVANSFITVHGIDNVNHRYFIKPFDQKGAFEDSEVFRDILLRDIQNITRLTVIKSQLETDGEYDAMKKIDIADYVNRTSLLGADSVTADYYVDDLIKWGNYGFDSKIVYGTQEDFDKYFALGNSIQAIEEASDLNMGEFSLQDDALRASIRNVRALQEKNSLSMRMIRELPASTAEYQAKYGENIPSEEIFGVEILIPRYFSVENRDLADYASSLEEYLALTVNLKEAATQLFHNYTEYTKFRKAYDREKTNIRYCYQIMVDSQPVYYTNLEEKPGQLQADEILGKFMNYGRYLYYNPDQLEIKTNTQIEGETIDSFLDFYEYAFGDDTKVWIAVDTAYGAADDLAAARNSYMSFMPYYWQTVGAGVLAFLAAAGFFVVLIIYEGRQEDESGKGYRIVLKRGDRVATEAFLLLTVLVTVLFLFIFIWGFFLLDDTAFASYMNKGYIYPLSFAIGVFLMDWICVMLYLGVVRRFKAHTVWKDSLLRRFCRFVKKSVFRLYDNSSVVSRVVIPFLGVMLLNLILGYLGPFGILVAGIADMGVACLLFRERKDVQRIVDGTQTIGSGNFAHKIDCSRMHGENKLLAEAVNNIGDGIQKAVAVSMKDERLKADLITNVSHDIKTPLTSIINFVNLLKREKIQDEKIRGYIEVLDAKSQRLKQLTDDLVEASKISSGNISLQMERINFVELINQTIGEFDEKFREKCLMVIANLPDEPVYIEADSRRIWRVVENLFGNICKYALEGTRVYLDIVIKQEKDGPMAECSVKNISAQPLNINANELTERFIRGDVSRSTEGSGLGLSIAKNLTELQNGKFDIYLDGDLFKVILVFPSLPQAIS